MKHLADTKIAILTIVLILPGLLTGLGAVISGTAFARESTLSRDGRNDSPVVADMEAIVETIEDEKKRKELVSHIRTLITVQNQMDRPEDRQSFSMRLTEAISRTVEKTFQSLSSFEDYIPEKNMITEWFQTIKSDPASFRPLIGQAMPVVMILVLAWMAEIMTNRLLARYRKQIADRDSQNRVFMLGLALVRAALRLGSLLVFTIVSIVSWFFIRPDLSVSSIAFQIFIVYIVGRIILIISRLFLAPSAPSLRLVSLGSKASLSLFLWIRRLVIVTLAGYLVAGTALMFGLPSRGFSGLMDILGMIILVMMIVHILKNRTGMASWIRGPETAPADRRTVIGYIRHSLAAIWHILAIFYLVGAFLIWWQNIDGGFFYLIRGTVLTVLLMLVARMVIHFVSDRLLQGKAVSRFMQGEIPILEQRLKYYAPIIFVILRGVITFITAIAILEAWKVDAHRWLAEPVVRQFLSVIFSMVLVVGIAVVIWEIVNITTEHYLAECGKPGHTPEHGVRLRTLLPLIRKALSIVLTVMVMMILLSEFGVNIGPLLAGAGIIGLAVGFGAQKLVQDVITGIFILLEDAVGIGDVVTVAGVGGLVEDISIRSIRLRDLSGSVHTIPFSSVDTVTNMTRLYSYYLIDIGVAYREDTDQVSDVCREIVENMRSEPEFTPDILEPLEILGVDRFDDSAVIIKARIKTRPIRQWAVGREFNRRMKKRFDELGIEIPFPHQTIYFGVGKDGKAPPAYVDVYGLKGEGLRLKTEG